MNKGKARHDQIYSFEHSLLQDLFEKDPAGFTRAAMENQDFVYGFWCLIENFTGLTFGITKEMFSQHYETIENASGKDNIEVVSIEFPTPVDATECYRAFILFEKDRPETAKMYMVEKASEMPADFFEALGIKPDHKEKEKSEKAFLCRWDHGKHVNYGSCSADFEVSMKRALDVYMSENPEVKAI